MIFNDVLSIVECEEIVKEFDQTENKNVENKRFYNNAIGAYNLPSSLKFVNKINDIAKTFFSNIEFQNSYTREYREESFLKIHRDRLGLDLTFSVCLENKNNIIWPIHVSKKECVDTTELYNNPNNWKEEYESIHNSIGQAIALQGTKFPHWRDEFPGIAGQRILYTFYHWKFI